MGLQVGKLSKAERQKRAPEADDQASQNSDGGEDDGAESSASENEAVDDGDLTVRLAARHGAPFLFTELPRPRSPGRLNHRMTTSSPRHASSSAGC